MSPVVPHSGETCVKVSLADRSYDIRIKAGLLRDIGRSLRDLGFSGKVAVVTNATIGRLYTQTVQSSLKAAGYHVTPVVLPEGERSKTLRTVSLILDKLAQCQFERGSVLVALGGGVIGDLAGFAAAIYVRGIPFIQVPTTLVAQVDSSVGGKTGVNHAVGKNLIGSFHQPRLVLIDPDMLKTLPTREWIAGLAEVIKYGVIADEAFFSYLERHIDAIRKMEEGPVVHVIARSCQIKASVVAQDERESNLRRILNFGHTVGHALESLGGYRKLIHGEAVAIGMVLEAELARQLGHCSNEVVSRLRALVKRAGLPDALPPTTFPKLWEAMQHDKKVAQGRVYCVLPEQVGRVVVVPLDQAQFKRWFSERRRKPSQARAPRSSSWSATAHRT